MLFLRTGLPGASKTLNTLKEICADHKKARPIYYNNIKLLLLDFEVCESFSGFFYGEYLPNLKPVTKKKYQKTLLRLHADDELASLEYFPHLYQLFDAWLSNNGHVNLWLKWVRRCYPASVLRSLNDYLELSDNINFDDLERFNLHWRSFSTPTLWFEIERNAIIVIDECQQWFPPRGSAARVPRHASEFETHRHKGYDIHLITQDAKLLDNHVRRLAGRHIHYFNPFASNRVTRYEADKVFDPDDYFAKQKTQKKIIKRDKAFYGVYWSADSHTHRFKIPKKALLLIPIILILPFLVWLVLSGSTITGFDDNESSSDVVTSSDVFSAPSVVVDSDFSVDSPLVLPSASFSYGDHPLAGICDRVVYSSRVTRYRPRSVSTEHLIQCEVRIADSGSDSGSRRVSRDDDSVSIEDNSRARSDNWDVSTFDVKFLVRLGYLPVYENGLFTLTYNNLKFIFPSM